LIVFPIPLEFLENGHHLDARPGIETAGRLVEQEQFAGRG